MVDWLSVFIGSIVFLLLSSFWYAPWVFGKIVIGLGRYLPVKIGSYFIAYFIGLVISYFLAFILTYLGVTSFWDGVLAGVVIYVGFIFPTFFYSLVWEKNKLRLFVIDQGFWLFSFLLLAGIVAG